MLRQLVIVGAFVGGVTLFAAPKPPPAPPAPPPGPPPSTDCDVGQRECRFAFDAHHAIALSLSPRPVQPAKPLVVQARFDGHASNPRVTFTGAAMSMPATTLPLLPRGQGSFVARGALPVCTEATMTWTARVQVDLDGEAHEASFAFVTRRGEAAPDAGVGPATPGDGGPGGDDGPGGDGGADGGADDGVLLLPAADAVDLALSTGSPARPFALSSLRGDVVLVAFGFTSCPDVCPTTLSAWASALQALAPHERARVRGVFVSVDPDRDSPAHVAQYAAYFDPNIIGTTGTRAQLDAAARTFGASYAIHASPGVDAGADYLVDHTVFTWLVAPDGRIAARLPHALARDATVAAVRRFLPQGMP